MKAPLQTKLKQLCCEHAEKNTAEKNFTVVSPNFWTILAC